MQLITYLKNNGHLFNTQWIQVDGKSSKGEHPLVSAINKLENEYGNGNTTFELTLPVAPTVDKLQTWSKIRNTYNGLDMEDVVHHESYFNILSPQEQSIAPSKRYLLSWHKSSPLSNNYTVCHDGYTQKHHGMAVIVHKSLTNYIQQINHHRNRAASIFSHHNQLHVLLISHHYPTNKQSTKIEPLETHIMTVVVVHQNTPIILTGDWNATFAPSH
ncbi:hypothetical protein ROZALSC1DRAFT_24950 [Rozella allomycis CSF55]|uniref:Endonuclease/exonuclease/phosphatase domain-containing protein n=1 Tax=Rozella allomycis (strain CSF55) TaxID=988480 RepID=A0A4P9YDN0_ROZAC|nr:hypothetical protein ROZALSC1DRAFT_24950 [Rozella allomycis CSF55]